MIQVSKTNELWISLEAKTHVNLSVHGALLLIVLVAIVWVHLQVVEGELLLDTLLESLALLHGQGVGLGDDRNDVDHIRQLLQHNNVNRLQ